MQINLTDWLHRKQVVDCPKCDKTGYYAGREFYSGCDAGINFISCPRCKGTMLVFAPWWWRLFGWPWKKGLHTDKNIQIQLRKEAKMGSNGR